MHTLQTHPGRGTPVDVPQPNKVNFIRSTVTTPAENRYCSCLEHEIAALILYGSASISQQSLPSRILGRGAWISVTFESPPWMHWFFRPDAPMGWPMLGRSSRQSTDERGCHTPLVRSPFLMGYLTTQVINLFTVGRASYERP